jgi:uncharacterized protein (DUF3820 family)
MTAKYAKNTKNKLDCQDLPENRAFLQKLLKTKMPFGKFKGRFLIDLPEPYVVWFSRQGFPRGELGEMLQIVYEIKVNGLEHLFAPLRQ